MGVLSDRDIQKLLRNDGFITPYVEELCRGKHFSHGLSSFGYDLRLAEDFLVSENNWDLIHPLGPAHEERDPFEKRTASERHPLDVYTGQFVLASTIERVKMPNDVVGLVALKSTYARCGLIQTTTVIEPGWEGHITLEFFVTRNTILYPGEGIVQLMLFRGESAPLITYANRAGGPGKYQNQSSGPVRGFSK